MVKAVIATESEEQIWHGPFVVPSEGEITIAVVCVSQIFQVFGQIQLLSVGGSIW